MMKYLNVKFFLLFVLLTVSFSLFSQSDKMNWWREARFGMFIHWGVYAVYGNIYDGLNVNEEEIHYDNRTSGIPSEWIMSAVRIPRATYREAAKEFDAKDYNPKEWVQIAKDAGMKYIVITAKHHDGFSLFETQHTDWNSIHASGAKRDLLKDLVKEAKDAGLKIGFYYSQSRDWMHEGGMGDIPELNGARYPIDKVESYVNNLVVPQIKELTTNYDIDVFWFDGAESNSTDEINQKMLNALLDSPVGDKIIYNDRLLQDGSVGDFSTPETDTPNIPYNGYPDDRDWEACASLNNSWGFEYEPDSYNVYNYTWKSSLYTVSRILELASKGGNFLLNLGPDKHGNIPEPAVNTLKEVGEWMKMYGEAIYGTQKNGLLYPFEYGYVTQKKEMNGSVHWYLHVSAGYWSEKEVVLPGVTELPQRAVLFGTDEPLAVKLADNDLVITLPDNYPDSYYSTLDLHFAGTPNQVAKSGRRNNQIRLTPFQAATTSSLRKDYIPYTFKHWYSKDCEIEYNIYLEAGEYAIEAEYAAWYEDGEIYFSINGVKYTGYYKNTGNVQKPNGLDNYIIDDFGGVKINIPESGIYSIKITRNAETPNVTNWINVRKFILNKVSGSGIRAIQILPTFIKKDRYFICNSPYKQTLRIYDLMGKLRNTCVVDEYTRIDVDDFESGVYIVKGDGFSQKLLIQ
jgi:alpha-L-fucosidase